MRDKWVLPMCAACVACALLACKRGHDSAPAQASAAPTESVAPAAASVALPAVAPRDVAAGFAPESGPWTDKFRLERVDGDQGANVLEAANRCRDHNLGLCTETQWKRACAADSEVGKIASWTATLSGASGFVVRGGSDCNAKSTSAGSAKEPARVGLCCEPAPAIDTGNKNLAFLRTTSMKLLKWETALGKHDTTSLVDQLDPDVDIAFYLVQKKRDAIRGLFEGSFRQYPDQWALDDICTVGIQSHADDHDQDTWTAECTQTQQHGGQFAGTTTRYVYGGKSGKVQVVKELRLSRNWSPP